MTLEEVRYKIREQIENDHRKVLLASKTPWGELGQARYHDGRANGLTWVLELLDKLDGEDDGK